MKNYVGLIVLAALVFSACKTIAVENNKQVSSENEHVSKAEAIAQAAMNDSMVTTEKHIGGTQYYDYNENKQFSIITRLLAQTVIQLEPGEKTLTTPYLSDAGNWEIAGDIWKKDGVDTQLVIVKPKAAGLYTNMLVITDKRLYNFILQSTKDVYTPMIKFQYPLEREFTSSMTKNVTAEGTNTIEKVNKDLVLERAKDSQGVKENENN